MEAGAQAVMNLVTADGLVVTYHRMGSGPVCAGEIAAELLEP